MRFRLQKKKEKKKHMIRPGELEVFMERRKDRDDALCVELGGNQRMP